MVVRELPLSKAMSSLQYLGRPFDMMVREGKPRGSDRTQGAKEKGHDITNYYERLPFRRAATSPRRYWA